MSSYLTRALAYIEGARAYHEHQGQPSRSCPWNSNWTTQEAWWWAEFTAGWADAERISGKMSVTPVAPGRY